MHQKSYDIYTSWDMECDRHNFLWFWVICCTFTPLLMPKIKIWKKTLDILSFYTCVPINEDHMIYGSWDIRHDGQSLIVILGHFRHFDPPNNLKIKILKKKKQKQKQLEILSFYTCVPQMTIIWCMVPDTERNSQNFLSLCTIFCPFTP